MTSEDRQPADLPFQRPLGRGRLPKRLSPAAKATRRLRAEEKEWKSRNQPVVTRTAATCGCSDAKHLPGDSRCPNGGMPT